MRKLLMSLLLVLAGCGAEEPADKPAVKAVPAASARPPACAGPEWRNLDFWVGEWIAEWEEGGKTLTGRNSITRNELGDCVITEHFSRDDGGLKGFSISTWRPREKGWRQTWMDDQGGFFHLEGGPVQGQPYVFELINQQPTPDGGRLRMIWQDVKPDAFTWRWQRENPQTKAWEDRWVIRYRKVAPS